MAFFYYKNVVFVSRSHEKGKPSLVPGTFSFPLHPLFKAVHKQVPALGLELVK